jgi:hypothetical protein
VVGLRIEFARTLDPQNWDQRRRHEQENKEVRLLYDVRDLFGMSE